MKTATEFLFETFQYEFCPECGGDADDHDAELVLGNWFARCRHPLPDNLSGEEIILELQRRHTLQEQGLPIVFPVVVFEIDKGTNEATETVHPFCSVQCRQLFLAETTPADGITFEAGQDGHCDEAQFVGCDFVCEHCGRKL